MSKQSSVQWLFQKLWDTPKDKLEWQSIFLMAHQMHQEEILDTWCDCTMSIVKWNTTTGDQYYNQTFGGQDERDRSILT